MLQEVKKLVEYGFETRRAWWFTATARTRARFSRTVIGSLWLGIANLLFSLVLGGVYGVVFKVPNLAQYFIYLGLGFSIWATLGGAINSSPTIFENNSTNILNSKIHPIFYVLEEWAFQIQTFIQSFILIIIFLAFLYPNILINIIIFSPIHILNLFLFILWLPLLICLAAVRYQDLYQLLPIFTQLIFLLSPIFYTERNLGELKIIADFNPIYQVLALLRNSLINGEFLFKPAIILLIVNLIMIMFSFLALSRSKKNLVFYI